MIVRFRSLDSWWCTLARSYTPPLNGRDFFELRIISVNPFSWRDQNRHHQFLWFSCSGLWLVLWYPSVLIWDSQRLLIGGWLFEFRKSVSLKKNSNWTELDHNLRLGQKLTPPGSKIDSAEFGWFNFITVLFRPLFDRPLFDRPLLTVHFSTTWMIRSSG